MENIKEALDGVFIRMALIIYLDDSDSDQSSVITIAGYAGLASAWNIVEEHLEGVCAKYDVEILHAMKFVGTKGSFKDWKWAKKIGFVEELYSGPTNQLIGLSFSGAKSFKTIKEQHKVFASSSLFEHEFVRLVGFLTRFHPNAAAIRREGLSFVIETGHKNNKGIQKWFDNASENGDLKGVLRSLTFVAKDSCRAIQISDFLAYHARQWSAKCAVHFNEVVIPKEVVLKTMCDLVPHHFDMISRPAIRTFDNPKEMEAFIKTLPNQFKAVKPQ